MTDGQTTFAKAHERAPLEAITEAIFETSRLSDCNAVVIRTAETAEALLAMLTSKRFPSRCEMTDAPLLAGLRIQLERTKDVPCGVCGQTVVVVGIAAGPHVASLYCATCDRHRGWLPKTIVDFLMKTISRFGWPTEAITIRNPEFAKRMRPRLWVHRGRNFSTLTWRWR
jgi:hypothetical protein